MKRSLLEKRYDEGSQQLCEGQHRTSTETMRYEGKHTHTHIYTHTYTHSHTRTHLHDDAASGLVTNANIEEYTWVLATCSLGLGLRRLATDDLLDGYRQPTKGKESRMRSALRKWSHYRS